MSNNKRANDHELTESAAHLQRTHTLKSHVRGSAVMLLGRGAGILLNLAVQVLLVRGLAVAEFGSFAFGLALATLLANCIRLGLDKGVERFVSIHEERREFAELAGVIFVAIAVISCLSLSVAGTIYVATPWLGSIVSDELSVSLLLILICLAPVQALDVVLTQLLAIFASAKILALRRHILIPALRLAAVGALLAFGQDARFLAIAWVISMIVAVALSVGMLTQIMRKRHLLRWFRPDAIVLRPGSLLRFSVPLLSFDLVLAMRNQVVIFLLGILQTAAAVAAFRAVFPVARLNVVIFESFRTLYVPIAARMYARGDTHGMSVLYWQSCGWILILTFPIFLVTFILSESVAVVLFGEPYAGSGIVMRWLAAAFFVNAVAGTNTLSLHIVGRVRTAVRIDIFALVTALILSIVLIAQFSALGGTIAACVSLLVQNGLTQWVLIRDGIVGGPEPAFLRPAVLAIALTIFLLSVHIIVEPGLVVDAALMGIAGAWVFFVGVRELNVDTTFPELTRVPLLGAVLSSARR